MKVSDSKSPVSEGQDSALSYEQSAATLVLPRGSLPDEGAAVALHRGRWIEGALVENQLVAVGGSVFSADLNVKVRLDYASFAEELRNWTPETIAAKIERNRASIAQQLARARIDLEPELVILPLMVQMKSDAMLQVTNDSEPHAERQNKYFASDEAPLLSDFRGISACAERALLAKHLFDRLERTAVYMGGVAAKLNSDGQAVDPVNHSFLIIPYNDRSIVFDVARKCSNGWPRLVVMDCELNLERFCSTDNLLVAGRSPFSSSDSKMLFGVGNPMALSEPIVFAK